MSEDKRRIITLLKRLYAAIKSTNKNVSSIKEDNMVLLWENSSPGSAFAAQTIALDLTDYKWVKIETLPAASQARKNATTNEFRCPSVGDTFAPTTRTDTGGSGWWHGSRTVEITTTGITFGGGGFRYSVANSQTANDSYGIPLRIWGVKKSYSVSLVKDVLPAENGGTGVTSLEELKSKLGVISGGGGSGGGGGPLTLSDSRLLQTYLSLRNKELWSGTEWKTGTKTIPGISNYEKLLVFLWDGYNGIELSRVGTNMFRGGGFASHVSSDAKIHTDIVMDLSFTEDDVVTIGYASIAGHITGGAHQAAQDGWAIRIVGVEPTAAYVKEKLGISDTTIENGKVKFAPVKIENKVLLWENPKPSEAFAKQTISVPGLTDYDAYSVVFKSLASESVSNEDFFTNENIGGYLRMIISSGKGRRYFVRSGSNIDFYDANYTANGSSSVNNTANTYLVPIAIYGIKNNPTVNIPTIDISSAGGLGGATVDPDKVITLKDYIVDEGASGIWTYRKWNSGIAECWGQKSQLVSSNNVENIDAFDFPFTFAEVPEVNVGCTANGADLYRVHNLSDYTTTSSMRLTFINKYTSGSATVTASIYVKGYWKALESGTTEVAAVKENTARLSIDMDGYEKSELLWTNPDPTTNIGTEKTITLDLSKYSSVRIVHRTDYWDGSAEVKGVVESDEIDIGSTGVLTHDGMSNTSTYYTMSKQRPVVVSTTGITFKVPYVSKTTSGPVVDGSACIPYKIYGIKTTSKLEGTVTGDNITLDIGVNKAADLNPDTLIPSGADLNDYLEFGSYLSPRKAVSASLSNCPHTTSGFSLQVIKTSSGGKMQLLTSNGTKCLVYMRHWDVTFSDWVQMGTTVVTKVWENASPNSNFAAQTLSIDLSGYSFVKIVTQQNLSSGSSHLTTVHDIPVGKTSHMAMVGSVNSQGQLTISRDATVSKSGISFETAYYKTTSSTAAGTAVTDSLIPLVIYAVKGVI